MHNCLLKAELRLVGRVTKHGIRRDYRRTREQCFRTRQIPLDLGALPYVGVRDTDHEAYILLQGSRISALVEIHDFIVMPHYFHRYESTLCTYLFFHHPGSSPF